VTDEAVRVVEPHAMLPSVKSILPQILIAGVLPVVAYSLLRPHVSSDAVALAAVMVFPVGEITFERIRRGRFEPIGIIALVGITIGMGGAIALHGNPMMLKLRESVLTGLFGVVCLGSLARRRPVMFYLGRAFATGGDKAKNDDFDELWHQPGASARFRMVTAVWGLALLAEAVLRTVLALALSTQRFLEVSPPVNWIILGGLFVFTRRTISSGEQAATADTAEVVAA
jgi:hypothetical protein